MTLAVNIAQGASNNVTFRNRIINGAMVISQRNAGASVTASVTPTYSVDRWLVYSNPSSKFTAQQTPSATETGYATRVGAGFTNYLGCTSSSAYTVTSGDLFFVQQYIEGFNTADLAFGTANAKTVTVSFLVYSSLTGTFGGALQNGVTDRSYPFSYSIPTANTWTTISVTITGDTGGTWVGATNAASMIVVFSLGMGSTRSGTAGAWVAGDIRSVTGATSVVGTSGATFYITGVQLEKGSTASPFEYRQYGTEFMLCQRYFQILQNNLGWGTVSSVVMNWQGQTVMRSIPTLNIVGTGSYSSTVMYYEQTPWAASAATSGLTINNGHLTVSGGDIYISGTFSSVPAQNQVVKMGLENQSYITLSSEL